MINYFIIVEIIDVLLEKLISLCDLLIIIVELDGYEYHKFPPYKYITLFGSLGMLYKEHFCSVAQP